MAPAQELTSVRTVQPLLQAASAAGVELVDLLQTHGLTAASLTEPDQWIPLASALALWEELPRRLRVPHFGLRAAQRTPEGFLGVVEYVIRHSRTLEEGIHQFLRYQRILNTALAHQLVPHEERVALQLQLRGYPDPPRHCIEFFMALIVLCVRRQVGVDWAPVRVDFRHAAPEDTAEHRQLFRAPLHFGQPAYAIAFEKAALALPARNADPMLAQVLGRHATDLLARVPAPDELPGALERLLREELPHGLSTIHGVARKLGLSQRTLQRRLGEHGTTYQQVVDAVRRELALEKIQTPELAVSDIAFLLGFSEASAFHRAFRRWTGSTPLQYRRGNPGGDPPGRGGGRLRTRALAGTDS